MPQFHNPVKAHGTPGLETKYSITHSNSRIQSLRIFLSHSMNPIKRSKEGKVKTAYAMGYIIREEI